MFDVPIRFLGLVLLLSATAAFAHQGVTNKAVQARMHGMKEIAQSLKVIGQMAKGASAFDAEQARQAASAIASHAGEITALFEANETDPKSEAKPAIWENYSEFSDKANSLEVLATELSASIASEADLKGALSSLGKSCKGCHSVYKE